MLLAPLFLCSYLAANNPGLAPKLPIYAPDASTLFDTPAPLQAAVHFWQALFTQYNSDQVVFVDRDNLGVVWAVINLPKNQHQQVDEIAATANVQRLTQELKSRLQRLANHPQPQDAFDNTLLQAAATATDRCDMQVAAQRLAGSWQRLRSQRGQAEAFHAGLQRSSIYLQHLRRIFQQEGVPSDLLSLPFVESMFNPRAQSAVGAVGLWQLMPKTARDLGLHVNPQHDERHNLWKASRAAARLLRHNYQRLGSWPLAITAYNHGVTSLQRAITQLGSHDLSYLIEHYQSPTWGFSSRNFYAEFLAARSLTQSSKTPSPPHA